VVSAARELARYLGTVALLLVAAIHAQQYYDAYFSAVPTIGRLFMLNVIGAGAAALVLLAPVHLLPRRLADAILAFGALIGISVAAGAFAALLVSEYTPLFGFMESGYRLAIVLSLLFEGLATVLLAAFVATVVLDRRPAGRAPAAAHTGSAAASSSGTSRQSAGASSRLERAIAGRARLEIAAPSTYDGP